jgi:hypothetical protein
MTHTTPDLSGIIPLLNDLDDLCICSKFHHTPISDIFINYGGDVFPKYSQDVKSIYNARSVKVL